MKRVVWIALIGLFATFATVEASERQEWDAFVLGGYTHGNLTGGSENLLGDEAKDGFTGGAVVQLRLADVYGFDMGLRYTRTGGGGTIDSTFSIPHFKNVIRPIGNSEVTLDYLEIPLNLVFFMNVNKSSYFRAYLGPSVNILIRAKATGQVDGEPIEQDLKSSMQAVHVTGAIGAGYVYQFDSWRIIANAYYSQGVTTVISGSSIKTSMYGVMIGVGLPLAKG